MEDLAQVCAPISFGKHARNVNVRILYEYILSEFNVVLITLCTQYTKPAVLSPVVVVVSHLFHHPSDVARLKIYNLDYVRNCTVIYER